MRQPDDLRGACTMLVETPATCNQQLPGSTYIDLSKSGLDLSLTNVADAVVYIPQEILWVSSKKQGCPQQI